jgi:sugar phosphate isomerase/epimerase
MKFAVQTSRLPGADLTEQFANAARFGFDAVEVSIGPAFDLVERFDDLRRAMDSTGVPVCAICSHSIHDPLVPDLDERKRRFEGLAEVLRLCDELGANGVISVPVRRPHTYAELADPDAEVMAMATEEFRNWAAGLPAGRSAVFLEPLNRYEATFLRRVEQAVQLAANVDHPRVQALADLFHMNIEESDNSQPILGAAGRLGHVHIADNNRMQPGAGYLDFATPFAALKQIGYDGFVSIECSALGGPLAAQGPGTMLTESARFLRETWDNA